MQRPSLVSTEVCGGAESASRIQPHLPLFTCRHCLVELHENCSKTGRNCEIVNKPHQLFAAPAKVRGYLRSPSENL